VCCLKAHVVASRATHEPHTVEGGGTFGGHDLPMLPNGT
jgi:hypothetical protein